VATVKSMFFKLRVANQSCLLGVGKTIRIFASVFKFNSFNTAKNCFVFVIVEFVNKFLNETERAEMFQLMADIKKKKSRYNFLVSLETVDRYIPFLKIYRKIIGKKIIKLSDTMEVLAFHKNYVKEHNIKLNLPKM